MPTVNIPQYIKNMGHRILCFILNIEDDAGIDLINGKCELSHERTEILNLYIKFCRDIQIINIDHGNIYFLLNHAISGYIVSNRHVFNLWREKLGGERIYFDHPDPVLASASKIALEIFPLSLVNKITDYYPPPYSLFPIHRLEEEKKLIDAVLADPSLSKLFTIIGENELDTYCKYMTSTGAGETIQLAVFPDALMKNAFDLMKIRGNISHKALLDSVSEIIHMLRCIAEGREIEVPTFMGFENVGLNGLSEIDLDGEKIKAYNKEILSLLPLEARPSALGGEEIPLGMMLEKKFPYKARLGVELDRNMYPPEFKQVKEKLDLIRENISFAMALAVKRTPPIGINLAWILIFDPLSFGTKISWNSSTRSPMPYHLLESNDSDAIAQWYKTINNGKDKNIRLAIRRIISALNERSNPIDGFIDSIVAWENLFGGNAELGYRISVSISKLLKSNLCDRIEFRSRVNNFYKKRSEIIHGTAEPTYADAVQMRDECVQIALDVIRKLYEKHQDLLLDKDRSIKLGLL